MLTRALTPPRGLRRRVDGSSSLEFALLTPMLIMMTLGLYDVEQLASFDRRLTMATTTMALMLTNEAITGQGTNLMTAALLSQGRGIIYPYFPGWYGSTSQTFSVTISAVAMSGVPAGCAGSACTSYVARTTWSNGGSQNLVATPGQAFKTDASQYRPCSTPLVPAGSQAASSLPNPTPNFARLRTLPPGLYGRSSLLVVDVSAVYKPLFVIYVTGPVTLARSAYLPARVGDAANAIPFDSPPGDATTVCAS